MRYLKTIVVISILFIFLAMLSITVVAAQDNGQTNIDDTLFLENVNLSVFDAVSTERTIQYFDVNEQGWFAVGYRGNIVHVYNEEGVFQYGYQFECNGDYGIKLLSENIVLYFVRGDTVAEFTPNGQLVSVKKAAFSEDVLDNIIYKTTKTIGNTIYSLERDIGVFNGDYSRLVATRENGEREILYDVTSLGYFFGIFHYLILISFPLLLFIAIFSAIKKEEQREQGDGSVVPSGELDIPKD